MKVRQLIELLSYENQDERILECHIKFVSPSGLVDTTVKLNKDTGELTVEREA